MPQNACLGTSPRIRRILTALFPNERGDPPPLQVLTVMRADRLSGTAFASFGPAALLVFTTSVIVRLAHLASMHDSPFFHISFWATPAPMTSGYDGSRAAT
jgi:hypothetical protein